MEWITLGCWYTRTIKKKLVDQVIQEKQGNYNSYKSDLIGKTKNTVLFFSASWCASCRAADEWIKSWVIPEDLTILKVDYDRENELKKKYWVAAQHMFVHVDKDWNTIRKWLWWTKIEDIVEKL